MKKKRQDRILEIIKKDNVDTQKELADRLREAGFMVTQATVSRDIRELKLTKVSLPGGGQKYAVLPPEEGKMEDRFVRVLRDGFVRMDMAQNILVIKTVPGMAMAVAAALDALKFHEVVGCIAGDDTIFAAVRTQEATVKLTEKLQTILGVKPDAPQQAGNPADRL